MEESVSWVFVGMPQVVQLRFRPAPETLLDCINKLNIFGFWILVGQQVLQISDIQTAW